MKYFIYLNSQYHHPEVGKLYEIDESGGTATYTDHGLPRAFGFVYPLYNDEFVIEVVDGVVTIPIDNEDKCM